MWVGHPYTVQSSGRVGVGASGLKVWYRCPKATVKAAPPHLPNNCLMPLFPRLSGGCSSHVLWGHRLQPHLWAQYWHNEGEVTIPSFLIWFWKCSTRGYVRHIHSPLTPTNLFVRWHSVCTTHFMLRRGYLKLLKEEESFDFMAGKKPRFGSSTVY